MNYTEFFNRIDTSTSTWDLSDLTTDGTIPRSVVDEIKTQEAKKKLNDCYGIRSAYPKAKKVYYDEAAGVTVVLWTDGTKTIVRAAEGDKRDAYLGYCTALAKKIHGTNSALKRDLEKVLVATMKKEKNE